MVMARAEEGKAVLREEARWRIVIVTEGVLRKASRIMLPMDPEAPIMTMFLKGEDILGIDAIQYLCGLSDSLLDGVERRRESEVRELLFSRLMLNVLKRCL